jgi:putative oxidoreductase
MAALLQQSFSAFPTGRPGVALLLLRAVVASLVIAQGCFYISGADAAVKLWVGAVALGIGIMLMIGLLTPIAGTLAGLGGIGIVFSVLPACTPNLFHETLSAVLAAAILIAMVLLGPGAFSADSRIFGRREIIIPMSERSQTRHG